MYSKYNFYNIVSFLHYLHMKSNNSRIEVEPLEAH
ncbi:hypothetical protein J2T15_001637 [Paenibacillus harenae]|uniref:Uncharacterized protein n=1 Tax=Paenibacillus harenae TaxID=306543 RepID=A0ABT9TXV8_PAEHA|nr:hypothetical protein [Paenibacillus harenae]